MCTVEENHFDKSCSATFSEILRMNESDINLQWVESKADYFEKREGDCESCS